MSKTSLPLFLLFAIVVACRSPSPPSVRDAGAPPAASTAPAIDAAPSIHERWVELYVAGWAIPTSLDLAKVTDVVLFGIVPSANGVDLGTLTDEKIERVTNAARAVKVPVLVCVGGEKTGALFVDAGAPLATAIARFVEKHGLDGVVLDIEPLSAISAASLDGFVRALRRARPMRIEAVVAPDPKEIARLAPLARLLDRVAIMSYLGRGDQSARVDELRAAGFPVEHIGLGLDNKTSERERAERIESAKRGTTGGLIVWHAATASVPELR